MNFTEITSLHEMTALQIIRIEGSGLSGAVSLNAAFFDRQVNHPTRVTQQAT